MDLNVSTLRFDDLNLKNADTFNFTFHFIARLQVHRRHASEPDARRGSGADDVAGLQCQSTGQALDDRRDIKDHVTGIAVLHNLTVDSTDEPRLLGIWHRAFVDDPWPYRTKSI